MRKQRRLMTLSVFAAGSLASAACSQGNGIEVVSKDASVASTTVVEPGAASPVPESNNSPTEQPPADSNEVTQRLRSALGKQDIISSGRAEFTMSHSVSVDGERTGVTTKSTVAFSGKDSETETTLGAGKSDMSVKTIIVGDTAYYTIGDNNWYKVGTGDGLGELIGQNEFLSPADAAKKLISGEFGNVSEVGTETIDGVEATRYDVTVSLDDLLEDAVGDVDSSVADAVDLDPFVISVWFDERDRMIKLFSEQSMDGKDDKLFGEMSITIDARYYDLDEPITIEAPQEFSDLENLEDVFDQIIDFGD